MKKSQTATEYLIILAVVIIIALIVVGVLGGIPGIGTGTSDRQKKLTELSNEIGISSYAVYDCGTKLTLRNNNPFTVQITSAVVNNTVCNSNDLPASLAIGESVQITCADICGDLGSRYSYYVNVTWKQVSSGGGTEFTQAGGKIEGIVGINTTGVSAGSDNGNSGNNEQDNGDGFTNITANSCTGLRSAIETDCSSNYRLMNNVNCGSEQHTPICPNGFSGTFDGQGKVIDGVIINDPGSTKLGLFAILDGGTIQDIGVTNVNIAASQIGGALVGEMINGAQITRAYSSGTVNCQSTICGGLVGWSLGYQDTISNSYSTASAAGTNYIGGLIGRNRGTILNSYATGTITGSTSGGLAGTNNQDYDANTVGDAIITNVFATGSAEHGITGYQNGGPVSNCYCYNNDCSVEGTYGDGSGENCISESDVSYFYSASNAPLSSWDFTTIWQENPGSYPTLR